MKRSQQGFGAVEGLLILIIILLVGFIGYYVYHSRNNTNSIYNNAAKTSANTPVKPQAASNQDPAVAFTQGFYDKYLKADGHDARDQLMIKYGSENSISAFEGAQGSDPTLCAQNDPLSITVTRNGGTEDRPKVTVHEAFGESKQDLQIQLFKYQGEYRLDLVTCPKAG